MCVWEVAKPGGEGESRDGRVVVVVVVVVVFY